MINFALEGIWGAQVIIMVTLIKILRELRKR